MTDLLSLPVTELAQETKKAIEYWKDYKNQEIRIEQVSATVSGSDEKRLRYGLQGTVVDVLSMPPGFVLEDAIEYYNPETLETGEHGIPEGGAYQPDTHDEIFIAFDSVERIVFVDKE
ncbi:hypothetical protein [Halosimplex halobium]|uniref:hypothetical protein n=1 Tax=Halosimplex halobium TaxID=3396618 RepID=UPI003F5519E9